MNNFLVVLIIISLLEIFILIMEYYIYVFMETRGEQFYFEVRNPSRRSYTRQELLHFFDKGVSSKPASANHGLGLFYLKSMIDKYDGTVGCECVSFDETFWTVFKFQI